MNNKSSSPSTAEPIPVEDVAENRSEPTEPEASYVKLAMRNMVRKRGTSLKHFALTTISLLGVLIGLAYLTR